MEQLFRLHARLSSLQELRDLIRALRALSASQLQEAQASLASISHYTDVVERAIMEGMSLLSEREEKITMSDPNEDGVLIAICSEHGFVGGLNQRLLDRAVLERKGRQGLVIVGQRGAMLAAERGLDIARSFSMATHVGGVLGAARRIAEHLSLVPRANVVFASYRRGVEPVIAFKTVLPLDPALAIGSTRVDPPLHNLKPDVMLQQLAAEYLLAEIAHAVMEALASENNVRLRIMEAADHNIGDKLANMRRLENSVRQEMITSELLEVVTGAEAILVVPA